MKGVDPEAMKRFQKLLKVYYKEYDMLEVSRLLEACVCLLLLMDFNDTYTFRFLPFQLSTTKRHSRLFANSINSSHFVLFSFYRRNELLVVPVSSCTLSLRQFHTTCSGQEGSL